MIDVIRLRRKLKEDNYFVVSNASWKKLPPKIKYDICAGYSCTHALYKRGDTTFLMICRTS